MFYWPLCSLPIFAAYDCDYFLALLVLLFCGPLVDELGGASALSVFLPVLFVVVVVFLKKQGNI